jgi:hypothetical protein
LAVRFLLPITKAHSQEWLCYLSGPRLATSRIEGE